MKNRQEIEKRIMEDLKEFGKAEIAHYMREFPREIDYNIAQYGNLLIYYYDIQELFKECGYKSKMSDMKAWEGYKRIVGKCARELMSE